MRVVVAVTKSDPLEWQGDRAMLRHADGDPTAFGELYDALSPSLRRFLRHLTNNYALTEDLLQQTFLHMHDKRAHFIAGAPVKPWAFAIARRLFIDSYRRSKRELVTGVEIDMDQQDSTTPEDWHAADEAAALATTELSRLPEGQRDAYILVKAEGMSHGEAAGVLGTTASAVRVRVHRAATALRVALGLSTRQESEESHDAE